MHNVLYYNIISIIYIAFMYIYVYIYRKFIFTYNTYLITALKLCYFQWNLIIWNNLKHRKIYHINWVIKCVRLYRLWAFQYAPSLRSNQSLNLWMYIEGFEFCFCFFFFWCLLTYMNSRKFCFILHTLYKCKWDLQCPNCFWSNYPLNLQIALWNTTEGRRTWSQERPHD